MKRYLFLALSIMLSISLTAFSQEQQKEQPKDNPPPAKKKPVSMDMNDFKAAPKEDKPAEETKETPKTVATPVPKTNPTPTTNAPVDPEASWPGWAKIQKKLLVAYLESQLNGEDPAPYFYYGNSAAGATTTATLPVNMRGSYGYKVLSFEGDTDNALWKFSVEAPAGRSSTAGLWFAVIKITSAGDAYRLYSVTRTNPYQNGTYQR